jgi:hypothetical protein
MKGLPTRIDSGIGVESPTEPHIEKELHVDVKPAVKEHTRVDSGIDIETPTQEPLGKLEPVVEAMPAAELEPRLESEIA